MPWYIFDEKAVKLYDEKLLVESEDWDEKKDQLVELLFGGEEKMNKWDVINKIWEYYP